MSRPEQPVVEPLPPPPAIYVEQFAWSPQNELVGVHCGFDNLQVFTLHDGRWTTIAEASQDRSQGRIFRPRLTFRSDGAPIATWEDFFPR